MIWRRRSEREHDLERELRYGVGATDPATFACVCGLMLAMAVIASYVPAWRAANLDPIRLLRAE